MEVKRTVWFLGSQEMNLTSKLHRDLGALITLALGPYEAPFTNASVVVGIEIVTSATIKCLAWKFLSLSMSGGVTS